MAKRIKHRNMRRIKRDRPFQGYIAKAFYASQKDLSSRIPELQPLQDKTVVVFGVGCLGAPSVLEFARAGIKEIRILDYDVVDPATTVRWPIGFMATGHKKVTILQDFSRRNYPYTDCQAYDFKLGDVKEPNANRPLDQEFITKITQDCDLIYDATTELGVQYFLTDFACTRQINYIGLAGTYGAWGGNVFRIRPWKGSGCFCCYLKSREKGAIPEPPSADEEQDVTQPTGCADPTFTGASFDMLQIALMGVRMAVSTLCEGVADAYPPMTYDVVHIHLRNKDGLLLPPIFNTYETNPNPECPNCHGNFE